MYKVGIVKANNYKSTTIRESLFNLFSELGLNPENPFHEMVNEGDIVFIKPNWVAHRYRSSCSKQYDLYTTITHPAVIKEVVLLVDKALAGKGKIIIGDNPSIDANFNEILKKAKLGTLKDECKSKIEFLDLRPLVCTDLADYGDRDKMFVQKGDPLGISEINLGKRSLFYGINGKRFRGVFKQRKETINAHNGENQLYGISNSIYQADLFISIPKLKAHHKTGVTLNIKGLVGTMGLKNYLVHWRNGFPLIGGDAYPNFWSWFKGQFKKIKSRGSWYGNDTTWRMAADLYQCFLLRKNQKHFTIIDGITGGQGNGPFCPEPIDSKVLIAGSNFIAVDTVAIKLMGFNPKKVKKIKYFLDKLLIDYKDITIVSDSIDTNNFFNKKETHLSFSPPDKWQELLMY